MESITHRELRNRSGEILRRVEAGESFEVTNNGRPAAMLVPTGNDTVDELVRRGEARAATAEIAALRGIRRVAAPVSTREIIDDLRGEWG
jgi:prevent-host-death family protein